MFAIYCGLGSGRIVLVGAPGAGKTGAMIRLLLDAVRHRKRIQEQAKRFEVPVPVLLTAYDWLPGSEGLADWVTRRLEDQYAFLKARAEGGKTISAARALVDGGKVSILLDGVDEMPEEARATVLPQLGRQARGRIVLSGRTGELGDAVKGGHLVGAAALELAAITPQEAADYLESRTTAPVPDSWGKLIRHLSEHDEHKDSPVAQALDSPLMLSLLLDAYQRNDQLGKRDQVDKLTVKKRFPNRRKIEDHLLDRILTVAYAPQPGKTAPPCTEQQARQWLGYLAAQMKQRGIQDLAWWRIPQWLPSRHRKSAIGLAGGLVNGLVSGLAFGIAIGIVFGPTAGAAAGLGVGLASGAAFGLAAALAGGLAVGFKSGLAVGLAFGVEVGLAGGVISGLRFGLSFGITVALTVALTALWILPLCRRQAGSIEQLTRNGLPGNPLPTSSRPRPAQLQPGAALPTWTRPARTAS